MNSQLIAIITSRRPAERDRSLESVAVAASFDELRMECAALDRFRRSETNLYLRVRALLFLHALHRFHFPGREEMRTRGWIPFAATQLLLDRRFAEAIDLLLQHQAEAPPCEALSSALAAGYHGLAFQTLMNQVRRSVRAIPGNRWMFRMGHPDDFPLRLRRELLPTPRTPAPVLRERTPVRMDLTHSAWSDIFFLGMDYPEGARVLNTSIDLAVRGQGNAPTPPIETFLRVIDRPLLRLISVDLKSVAEIDDLSEVFDFARDYLGLLKAAVIAAGIVPPGLEASGRSLPRLLNRLLGPGRGLELSSHVRGIPKGSRLAVSTNLLASLISLCLRATSQAKDLEGPLSEDERRIVAGRAILGEWLGGSGGGWQDSAGLWPGMKLICGERAQKGDPEFGVSRGRLLPTHRILGEKEAPPGLRRKLAESLVLVHGGMAQDVGPILEMVTEKYLLRSEAEWEQRQATSGILAEIMEALKTEDIRALGRATTRNFDEVIQTIIPSANNHFTQELISRTRSHFGDAFWGFWMLGGLSGGGMGFLFHPGRKAEAQRWLQAEMSALQEELATALPFAMHPVVYDFSINERGTCASLLRGETSPFPRGHDSLLRTLEGNSRTPEIEGNPSGVDRPSLRELLKQHGFDSAQHESIRSQLRAGLIGLAQNRLPAKSKIEDVDAKDVEISGDDLKDTELREAQRALRDGEVAVVCLAAGSGSRWTRGGGVVKALSPFFSFAGEHRSFLEVHLAKSRKRGEEAGRPIPTIVTTSYLSHAPIEIALKLHPHWSRGLPLLLSRGCSVGLRLIPMTRDLLFEWNERPQQLLDPQAQKVRESLREALLRWADDEGEGADYEDNIPSQCLHPVGHGYEVPNLLLNGTLQRLLESSPQLRTLFLHNIDTLGADVDPELLARHRRSGATISFEVIPKRLEDRGGGLARVDGNLRLIEGLALPREEDEWRLSYYSTLSSWIDIDRLLDALALTRETIADSQAVSAALRRLSQRLPTYVTLKEVKKRWGLGQEDVFPVAQFEKLWGDMSSLSEIRCHYLAVARQRGQQLKDPALLDAWRSDGSAAFVQDLCSFG